MSDVDEAGLTQDELEARAKALMKIWGNGDIMKTVVPSQAADRDAVATMAKMERLSSSPGALRTIWVPVALGRLKLAFCAQAKCTGRLPIA